MVIDTKGWKGWEWTHGIALTALYHVSASTSTINDPLRPTAWEKEGKFRLREIARIPHTKE
jgi:unsaturated rhamnogalacturonyl hydrolase